MSTKGKGPCFSLSVCSLLVTTIFFLRSPVTGQEHARPLKVLTARTTPNGFDEPPRGWNSFGLQQNPAINPSFSFDQQGIIDQANALLNNTPQQLLSTHDYYISLDSGWSVGDHGDDHGRIMYDTTKFDIPALAKDLHSKGLKLGIYLLPGAFCNDVHKTILNTSMPIRLALSGNNNGFSRCDFDFSKDGAQQWHDTNVALFASWGVDLIKLDYITPGSPSNHGNLPADNSGAVIAYHKAIAATGRKIRLAISWKLERGTKYQNIWSSNADSQRTDQDINNSGKKTFVDWATVQRAIDNYRDFISRIVNSSQQPVTTIYPDMDSMYIGNGEAITGVSDALRTTIATHWIGAAANLISGSDMSRLDQLGVRLLTDDLAMDAAQFTAKYPMQPRNPGTGGNDSKQLQAWIAGPDASETAFVVLANYGPDQGQGGFNTKLKGPQSVQATFTDLGINGSYHVVDVWTRKDHGILQGHVGATLGAGESVLFKLTRKSE